MNDTPEKEDFTPFKMAEAFTKQDTIPKTFATGDLEDMADAKERANHLINAFHRDMAGFRTPYRGIKSEGAGDTIRFTFIQEREGMDLEQCLTDEWSLCMQVSGIPGTDMYHIAVNTVGGQLAEDGDSPIAAICEPETVHEALAFIEAGALEQHYQSKRPLADVARENADMMRANAPTSQTVQ